MEVLSYQAPTTPSAPVDPLEPPANTALLRALVRLRWPIFLFIALLQLAAFNGQWRVGRDGALYREVAHNLVTGQGYTFRGERETHIFPGLPKLLAAIDTHWAPQDPLQPTAALLVMLALAGLTLLVTYHLVLTHFPQWIAVFVTAAVGLSRPFMEQAHDLMTDVPFLLGFCLTLLGIGQFSRTPSLRKRLLATGFILIGAILAVSMRPTFWALAISCILLCLIGLVRSPRRLWYAAGAIAVIGLVALWWSLDPRTSGFNPLGGKYERMALTKIQDLAAFQGNSKFLLTAEKHLPQGIFSLELIFPLGTLFLLNLILWAFRLFRKTPLWSLCILATLLMTFTIGGKPRYYLMCLPLILVAWTLSVHYASQYLARRNLNPDLVLALGLGLVILPNLGRCIGFAFEQHGFVSLISRKPFLQAYRDGEMFRVYQISQLIRQHVPANSRVIAIEDRITTYLSGRPVFQPTEIFQRTRPLQWRILLRKYKPGYLVFGPALKEDPVLNKLVTHQIVEIDQVLATQDGITLARIHIPPGLPPTRIHRPKPAKPVATQPTTRRGKRVTSTAPTTRRLKSHRTTTQPTATQPTTRRLRKHAPTTQPATQPTTRRLRHRPPTTQPLTTQPTPRRLRKRPPTTQAAIQSTTQPTPRRPRSSPLVN